MLYLTTRNKADSFTAYKVLRSASAPDGGQFLPMQIPVLTDIQLAALEQMSFGETTAFMLNLFFGTQLTGWDVDFAIGRQAMSLTDVGYRVSVAETWHNPAGNHNYMVSRLYTLALGESAGGRTPNLWFYTVIDIAVLFAAHCKYCQRDIYEFDVAIQTGDLQMLLALRYAQKMGLRTGKILLGCQDGDSLWEFVSYGDYSTGRKDLPSGMEAVLWLEFGPSVAGDYLKISEKRGIYKLNPVQLEQFRDGIFVAVVGDGRAADVASGVLRTTGYQMDQSTARAFGAMQDYRSKYGDKRDTLLFAHNRTEKKR